jgi:hypothetical protein
MEESDTAASFTQEDKDSTEFLDNAQLSQRVGAAQKIQRIFRKWRASRKAIAKTGKIC